MNEEPCLFPNCLLLIPQGVLCASCTIGPSQNPARTLADQLPCWPKVPSSGCFLVWSAFSALNKLSCLLAGTTPCHAKDTGTFCQCPGVYPLLEDEVSQYPGCSEQFLCWVRTAAAKICKCLQDTCRMAVIHSCCGHMQTLSCC